MKHPQTTSCCYVCKSLWPHNEVFFAFSFPLTCAGPVENWEHNVESSAHKWNHRVKNFLMKWKARVVRNQSNNSWWISWIQNQALDSYFWSLPWQNTLFFLFLFFLTRVSLRIFIYALNRLPILRDSDPRIPQNWQFLLRWGFDFNHPCAKISTSWDTVLYSSDFWESKTAGKIFFPLERLLDWSYKDWHVQQYCFCFHGSVVDKALLWQNYSIATAVPTNACTLGMCNLSWEYG